MLGRGALIAVLVIAAHTPVEAKEADPEPPPPAWLEDPFHGFDIRSVRVGVGVSEVKPDMDITRAISRARAAHSLAASLRKKAASLQREYSTDKDNFTEYVGKGFTVRRIAGFCSVKLLIRDYSNEINQDSEGMIERAMLVEFPSGSSSNVMIQEYTNPAGTSLWTRLIVGGNPSPDGGFKYWKNPHLVKVRDYFNVFASGEEEVYLKVSLQGKETDISWVEDTVSRRKRIGTLKVAGVVSKYKIYGEMEKWAEDHAPMDFSSMIQAGMGP